MSLFLEWFLLSVGAYIMLFMRRLFKMDKVSHMASVELWVLFTTFLLVVRFVLDFFGPWNAGRRSMVAAIQIIEMLNYAMVHYTMGLMQLSAAKVNDYFQVWAVLLITLQYSVKIGRPYSRSKQAPLMDLMSSFWAANLIRLQTFSLLKIPLWLIWTLNSVRIISYFFSSDKAAKFNRENTRLVSDYMRYEHTLGVADPRNGDKELTASCSGDKELMIMQRCRYLVLGEDEALKEAQLERRRAGTTVAPVQYMIQLNPCHEKLVTVDKIWKVASSSQNGLVLCSGNKDVCLSFALYKLLRRRFYDLPLHEVGQEKAAQLVFGYILQDGTASYERAFRVAALELSFLQDLFYSKHADMFASGFPSKSLLLSVLLIAATGYIAYPVHRIPKRMDQADHNTITHGVFITRLIIAIILVKELSEIYLYVFSQWTKVMILCKNVRFSCLRHRLVEMVMRAVFWFITRGEWDLTVRQYNLLISPVWLSFRFRCFNGFHLRDKTPTNIKLEPGVKKALLDSFKGLEKCPERLESYFQNAFRSNEDLRKQLIWAVDGLEADTHRILVWHIATCLCEINLSNEATVLKVALLQARPLVDKSTTTSDVWPHYQTAATLSNYCAYLLSMALVLDNGFVANMVFREVRRETLNASFNKRFLSLQDVYDELMSIYNKLVEKHEKQVPSREQDGGQEVYDTPYSNRYRTNFDELPAECKDDIDGEDLTAEKEDYTRQKEKEDYTKGDDIDDQDPVEKDDIEEEEPMAKKEDHTCGDAINEEEPTTKYNSEEEVVGGEDAISEEELMTQYGNDYYVLEEGLHQGNNSLEEIVEGEDAISKEEPMTQYGNDYYVLEEGLHQGNNSLEEIVKGEDAIREEEPMTQYGNDYYVLEEGLHQGNNSLEEIVKGEDVINEEEPTTHYGDDDCIIEEGLHQGNNSQQEDVGDDDDSLENSIIMMGTKLGKELMESYGEDSVGLWRDLAEFWAGFLLHLAAYTRASKHRTHLTQHGELITILWALLSHAGFVGKTSHGHTILDPDDLDDADPLR